MAIHKQVATCTTILPEWQKEYQTLEKHMSKVLFFGPIGLLCVIFNPALGKSPLLLFAVLMLFYYYLFGRLRWLRHLSHIVLKTKPTEISVMFSKSLKEGYMACFAPQYCDFLKIGYKKMFLEEPSQEMHKLFSLGHYVPAFVYCDPYTCEPIAVSLKQGVLKSRRTKAMRSCFMRLPWQSDLFIENAAEPEIPGMLKRRQY